MQDKSPESLVSLMNVKKLFESVSDFVHDGPVVVVSEVSGFDVDAVEPIIMSDFVSPDFLDMRVLEFGLNVRVNLDVLFDQDPVLVMWSRELNNFVSHFD